MLVRSHTMYKMFRSSSASNPGQPRSTSSGSNSPELPRSSGGGGYGTRSRSETPPRPPPLPREFVKRKTPPRPSPPRILAKPNAKMMMTGRRSLPQATEDDEEPVPPRPPPPISYVSTLPPPVPKKTPSPRNAAKYSAKTLPMRRVSMPKQKPLQRVQPLQVL